MNSYKEPSKITGLILTSIFALSAAAPVAHALTAGEIAANQDTIKSAQENVSQILKQASTAYRHDLASMQSRFTGLWQESSGSKDKHVIFVDPNVFQSAKALGFDARTSLEETLKIQNAPPLPRDQIETAQPFIAVSNTRPGFVGSYTDPVCLVIPESHYADIKIPSLSPEESRNFINHHEGWHCLDSKYKDITESTSKIVSGLANPKTFISSPEALTFVSNMNKMETFADLGAVSDMIRNGASTSIIDKIIEWRITGKTNDPAHFSAPGLHALKGKIEAMGIDQFKKLDDKSVQNLCYEVTDSSGLSPQKLKTILEYSIASPLQKVGMQIDAVTNPEKKDALTLLKFLESKPPHSKAALDDLTRIMQDVQTKLDDYDPRQALEDRALSISSKITPETMVKAHAQLQTEFYKKIKESPDTSLYSEQARKLNNTFTEITSRMNYAAANKPPKI